MRGRHVTITALGVLVAVGAGYFAFVRGETSRNQRHDVNATMLEECDRSLADCRMIDMNGLSPERVCPPATCLPDDGVPAPIDALTQRLVEFLRARFVSSAAEYVAWRTTSGYAMRTRADLDKNWPIADVIPLYRGSEIKPNEQVDALFLEAIAASDAYKGGRQRIVGVSLATDWSVVVEQRTFSKDLPESPAWGEDARFRTRQSFMYFPTAGSAQSWWSRGTRYFERANSKEGVLVATVSFFAEFADGARLPVAIVYFFDAARQDWTIEGLSVAAHTMSDLRRIEF